MSELELAVLGFPSAKKDGAALSFRTHKTLALLVYLAIEPGLHARTKLTSLFWPDSTEAQGRSILRTTLFYLRQALGASAHTSAYLQVTRDALGLAPEIKIALDINILQRALGAATDSTKGKELQLCQKLEKALSLYRGPFLDGLSLGDLPAFDEWARIQRAFWHHQVDRVFDQLSRLLLESGEVTRAREIAMRWIAHEPGNEAGHRRLMQVYIATGDQQAALDVYHAYRVQLARESDTGPTPEMEALAARLRSESKATTRGKRTAVAVATPATSPLEIPLVGRRVEVATLTTGFYAVNDGMMQVVLVEGEAGIGKTKLVSAFLDWAAAQGADVLRGRAFETGGRLPYGPLIEALRSRLERENAPEDLLSDVWLTELSRILPELQERYPDLPQPLIEGTEGAGRLFEAIVQLGEALARKAPLLLFLDDLQWADVATEDVLAYATRRWTDLHTRILLVLAVRREDLLSGQRNYLQKLKQAPFTRHLELGPLARDEVVHLVTHLARAQPGLAWEQNNSESSPVTRFGHWLFQETDGHPLFLVEMIRALLERGVLDLRPSAQQGWVLDVTSAARDTHALQGVLPPSVREIIRLRLARFTSEAQDLLLAAAVLEDQGIFEALCQVADLGETRGLQALDEVLHGRIVQEAGEQRPGYYIFAHDKVRTIVYAEAGEARRRVFHKRAFQVLQAMAASKAEISRHALAAGLLEPAASLCIQAADEAMAVFAVQDAIVLYERARQLLRERRGPQDLLHSLNPLEVQQLYTQLGLAYQLRDEWEKAKGLYEELLAFAGKLQNPLLECAALIRLAGVATGPDFDLYAVKKLLLQARQLAEVHGDLAGVAEATWNLAQLGSYSWDPVQFGSRERWMHTVQALGRADLIARSVRGVRANAHLLKGTEWVAHSSANEAARYAEEAHALYAQLGNQVMEADCLCLVASANIEAGWPKKAIQAAQEALSISLKRKDPWRQIWSTLLLAWSLQECGDYAKALQHCQEACQSARTWGFSPLLCEGLFTLGTIHGAFFQLEKARAAYEEAQIVQAGLSSSVYIEVLLTRLCAIAVLTRDWEQACKMARQALDIREQVVLYPTGLWRWYEIEALLRDGEEERTILDIQRFSQWIGNNQRYQIPYLRSQAVLRQWQGKKEQAMAYLEEAAALAERLGLPAEGWPIYAALGELSLEVGKPEQSQHAFARSVAIIEELAAQIADPALRQDFLQAPHVRSVLDQQTIGPQ
ncbi:hypothetical protein EPA93_11520 [Ktedonosporobacter rubrisoli]|uniref:Bacterial transcriptional activator domain-containing protein n=1 Tax=Ktedonosporobacter rubrisoli TaxID=2509675 RepID=A0A4P6JMT7_KTERU|nr:AAA family ATPase [Ktedonosporobacter rubrisoli]QBD76598.1 hypothetical protein EPA93_11520 [Ktedonosporobacter rubrisoli]